jgi:IclR family pca regulon transcriptional regulator
MLKENHQMFVDKEDIKENYIVSSLVRGLKILSTFTVKQPSLKVSEIAELANLDQATVFRFVYTLERLGYLVREEDTKRYHQGVRMLTLCLPARKVSPSVYVALPYMNELSKITNETVKLGIVDNIDVVRLPLLKFQINLFMHTDRASFSGSLHSSRKVLLAFQPMETWETMISQIDFSPRTEKTIVDPQKFRECLLETRNQGYALQDGEQILGLSSLAAPIYDSSGKIVAGLNVSGLSIHFLEQGKPDFLIDELIKCATNISTKLGYSAELLE